LCLLSLIHIGLTDKAGKAGIFYEYPLFGLSGHVLQGFRKAGIKKQEKRHTPLRRQKWKL
jgi:hypothetical protein